jgi:phytoene desaturase
MSKKVIIIGAGLGSLASALRLTTKGYQVKIIEKHHQSGGRLNQLKKDGFTFDVGPSFYSMSYEFDELFKSCGIPNPIEKQELDPLYSVKFAHLDKPIIAYKDLALLQKEFGDLEPDFKRRAEKYLKKAAEIFHDTEKRVVKQNFDTILQYLLALSKVPLKHLPKLFRTMWTELDNAFESEEAKVIFSLISFFLGTTPFDTPAVYSLLNYTEFQHDGYWNVKGGMYKIVEHLETELRSRGVEFVFNSEITEVIEENNHLVSVTDQNGNSYSADIFISNADAASFRGKQLKREAFSEEKLDKKKWSLAPFTIYLGVKGEVGNLIHHNFFLGSNFKEYADTIFKTTVIPEKPYYYVNVASKSNPEMAPPGHENLFILCPVPDLRFKKSWKEKEAIAEGILKDLSKSIGFDLLANKVTQTIYTPEDWESQFNLYRGSGLGLAHDMNQVGYFRPSNKDEKLKNMYYVGASTTPGTGLPIVVIGSKLVTDRIEKDYGIVR